ncbi:MAG: hypothetical protein ABI643_02685 [Candidatus Doudnabacteria bacterium]
METDRKNLDQSKICDLCRKHDPLVKNYAEDYELQTSLRNYVEKTSGERINVADIAQLCDSCYSKVKDSTEEDEE